MAENESLFATLYTDEDISDRMAVLVRQRGYNAKSAREADMIEQSDEAQLTYAAAHGMVLLTFNQRDFVSLARQWAAQGRDHSGILLSDQFSRRQLGELLRRVLKFLNTVPPDEMINTVRFLSEFSSKS
jgi:predicted nuclease of predicted toxin-antitoxin system